jgi:hypothetical protein
LIDKVELDADDVPRSYSKVPLVIETQVRGADEPLIERRKVTFRKHVSQDWMGGVMQSCRSAELVIR